MKNRISRPSPAMVVALIALVLAMTGSAVAAVSFARNAGAVDSLSAVSAGSSTTRAAGRLVATTRLGVNKGRFSSKFLPASIGGQGLAQSFGRSLDVADNATGVAIGLVTVPGIGTLTTSCNDQAAATGREDPSSSVSFVNQSGDFVDLARTVGNGAAAILPVAANTVHTFTINGSNTFELNLQRLGVNVVIHGVVRQDGSGTGIAKCLVYGQSLRVG